MNLAIVADWLVTYGGAEHTISEFHQLWPDAPLFTTVAKPAALGPLKSADIRVSPLQRAYRLMGKHQLLLPLMPRAIEGIDLTGYDVVLSSSHAVAKGVVPPATAVHVCYCHTPMRYAWEMEAEYLKDFRVPTFLRKTIKRHLRNLRRWDLTTAKRVDVFLANSTETQRRISRIYNRDSRVIPPPVDDRFFEGPLIPPAERGSYLAVGRLVPYKRFDLLIACANRLGIPLDIAGRGQDEERLKKLAGPTVRFLGYVPEAQLPALYAKAKALLFPPYEDAGIVPLEAQAAGTPVVALGKGGALDTVKEGVTGAFFAEQTEDLLLDALGRLDAMRWEPKAIRAHAQVFSEERFRREIRDAVEAAVEKFN